MPSDRPARILRLAPHWVLDIDATAVRVRGELDSRPVAGPDFDQLTRDGRPVSVPVTVRLPLLLRTDAGTHPLPAVLTVRPHAEPPLEVTVPRAGRTIRVTATDLRTALHRLTDQLAPDFLRTCATCRFGKDAGRLSWQWCRRPTLNGAATLVPASYWCDQHEPCEHGADPAD